MALVWARAAPLLRGGRGSWVAVRTGLARHAAAPAAALRGKSTLAEPEELLDDSRFIGMTGAEIFHEMMRAHKVDTVFGYPGGAILPVFDAIYESKYFKFVLSRHEQGAGFMAEGYARTTGKPGVVLVTSGPAATNTLTACYDAMADGTPLIICTGQVPVPAIGSDAFQESDAVGASRPLTKWNCLVKDVAELPRRINEAFEIATSGRPGPVLLDLPKDVTAGKLTKRPDSTPKIAVRMKQKVEILNKERLGAPGPAEFRMIADMVNQAEKPIIYAGQGVVQSQREGSKVLREFAEKANIPVTTTLHGMGAFDERHPLALKMLGMHGSAYANYSIQDADLILALGARFDDRVTGRLDAFAPEAKRAEREGRGGIVHFEISPKNLHKVVNPTVAVLGDVITNLEGVLPHVEYKERKPWFDKIAEWKQKHPLTFERPKAGEKLTQPMIIHELDKILLEKQDQGKDVYISTGVGTHQMFAAQFITWTKPRQVVTSGGAGTMGYGAPAAIGAQVAHPEAIVIDIDGDASWAMTFNELLTAVQFNIPAKFLVLDNAAQTMVRQWQTFFYNSRYSATDMVNPCYAQVAEAMGAKGFRVDTEDQLESTLREFVEFDEARPSVCVVHCCKDTPLLPMVPAGAGLSEMILTKEDAMERYGKKE